MVAPGTCNDIQERCIYGYYCTGSTDTCTGVCHPSCFKCSGTSASNCTQCSPLTSKGKDVPSSGSCSGSKLNFYFYKHFS